MSSKTYKREVAGASVAMVIAMAFMGMTDMVGLLAGPVFIFATAMFGADAVVRQTNIGNK
tara:strand:- start:355 stop:534 length:180 start_codon:yes stop_codon:yes gene_type:complete